jgi:hypothetical protein
MRWRAAWLLLAACGRLQFDPLGDGAIGGSIDDSTDGAAAAPCASGEVVRPIAATNASPIDSVNACNVANALAADGAVAGLDLIGMTENNCVAWGHPSRHACGCLAADLGMVYELESVRVRATYSDDACGIAPCAGAGFCNTAQQLGVWTGISLGAYEPLDLMVDLTSPALADYSLTAARKARYIVVCRISWSYERDDVVVDEVAATCM